MPFRRVFGQVFSLELVIAIVVFGLVLAAMAVAMMVSRRKRRRSEPASPREHLHAAEAIYGLALAGMAAFLVFTSFSANAEDFPRHDAKPALTVRVTAYQWCWRFHYAGQPVTVTAACAGSGRYPTLVLPVGERVRIDLTSADVLHAFWVPHLDYKMDAFPGHVDTFTVTIPRPGRWIGRCAQLCGLYHYDMDFYLQAVPPAQFARWLKANGGTLTAGKAR
ncbi:MAG: cytochrome c oxidase subunit II [Streptosporangiaceae bacterium]